MPAATSCGTAAFEAGAAELAADAAAAAAPGSADAYGVLMLMFSTSYLSPLLPTRLVRG